MKPLSTQRWILSTLLFAALGSQYYFSESSKNSGVIEMSSGAGTPSTITPTAAATVDDMTKILNPEFVFSSSGISSEIPILNSDPNIDLLSKIDGTTSADVAAKKTTEAAAAAPCDGCVTLTKEQVERLRTLLLQARDGKTDKEEVALEVIDETPLEKKQRLRDEAKDARELAKQAKEDKKRSEQEDRDDKFVENFEDSVERCADDIECRAERFARALSRTSKSKPVSANVVNSTFKKYIETDLKEALSDPGNEDARNALKAIMSDIPSEYKSLKQKSINIAKSATEPKAIETNASFKQAEELRKANKLNESSQIFAQAMEEKKELELMINDQHEAITYGLDEVSDKSTLNYYNLNYAKDARKWLSNIMSGTDFKVDTDVITNPTTPTTSGRGVVRGGNGNTTTGSQISNKIGTNDGLSNVQFGSPQQGTRGTGRGAY